MVIHSQVRAFQASQESKNGKFRKKVSFVIPKALFTRGIFTHNIAIKRYCDKKIFSGHGCQ